jgi:hypothetical protein
MAEALRLIESAALDPETLKIVGTAFDEAWAEIAPRFAGNDRATKKARIRLVISPH